MSRASVVVLVGLLGLGCTPQPSDGGAKGRDKAPASTSEPGPTPAPTPDPTPDPPEQPGTADPDRPGADEPVAFGPPTEASAEARTKLALALLGDGRSAASLPVVASDPGAEFDPDLVAKLDAAPLGLLSGPIARLGPVHVEGELAADVARRAITAHLNELSYCYALEWAKDKTLEGKVELSLEIDAKGKVSAASVDEAELASAEVGACMARASKRWRFPAASGPTTLSVPLRLRHVGGL